MNGKRLFAASYGHFSIDSLNSTIPIILTAVATNFNLSVSQIGLAAMIYTLAASLTQPLFGILVDRLRGRWIAGLGLVWMMCFYAAAPFMPNYPLLVLCLSLGALGSGAFHPAGMINSTMAGGHRPTIATSLFFVGGQTGLALGPTVAGVLLQNFGLAAMPYMALAMTPGALFMLWFLRQPYEEVAPVKKEAPADTKVDIKESTQAASTNARTKGIFIAVAFVLLITFRSTTQQGFTTLLPKFFADQGYTPAVYGAMLSVLGIAGATGTLLGGWLGDRFNRRMVILISMTLAAFFSFAMLYTNGWVYTLAALGAGSMMNVPHSILIIMAQRLIPARRGMIGGAVLGLMFASGAATTGIGSWVADFVGLPTVLSIFALLPIGAGICALAMPSTRGAEPVVAMKKPAQEAAPSAAGD
jgi:MFS transporter, FSR family, fosmidomycin resistance protein